MKDFKKSSEKMYCKKIFILFVLFLGFFSVFIFTACDFLQFQIGNETKEEEEPAKVAVWKKSDFSYDSIIDLEKMAVNSEKITFPKKTGKVFLLKSNNPSENKNSEWVQATKTGWVENYTTKERSSQILRNSFQDSKEFYQKELLQNSTKSLESNDQNATVPYIKEFEKARQFERNPCLYLNKIRATAINEKEKGENEFYIFNKNEESVLVEFEKKASGTYCEVYYVSEKDSNYSDFTDKQKLLNGKVSETDLKNLATVFDKIYKKETEVFSSTQDTAIANSANPSFIESSASDPIKILVFDIDQDSSYNQTSGTFGYFYGADVYKQSAFKKSNEGKIIYIDDYFLKKYEKTVYSTLAHEYQHLLCFLNKTVRQNVLEIPTWYTEMLSMVCEDYMIEVTGNSRSKMKENPLYSRLYTFTSGYYLGFENWNSGNDVLSSYANAYTFGAFLVRNFNGTSLIKEIVSNSYAGKDSVAIAVSEISGKDFSFSEIVDGFSECLLATDDETSMYSLNKKFDDIYSSEINLYKDIEDGELYPSIFSPFKEDGRVPLGIGGFSLHYIGKNILEINFSLPKDPDVHFVLLYEPD